MCGIVGAVFKGPVDPRLVPILMEGLRRLEYRGYDSAGLAILDTHSHLMRLRAQGKVAHLAELAAAESLSGHVGMAHTRWATHGVPSEVNSHPHVSGGADRQVAIIHNGIIENHVALREKLIQKGYVFQSETDSETVAHLIFDHLKSGVDFKKAVLDAGAELEGAFALGILSTDYPDRLIAVQRGCPVVIGLGEEANFFASDYMALLANTQRFIYLEEGDCAEIFADHIEIYNRSGEKIKRPITVFSANAHMSLDKGKYRHFMQKEIFEQPRVVQDTLEGRLSDHQVMEGIFGVGTDELFKQVEHIHIVACGTSYHVGMVAQYWLEALAGIDCRVEIASEYRYRETIVPKNTLFIVVSQSGETADTLAALKKAKQLPYLSSLAICNMPESAIVREAEHVFLTRAGREVSVASTKAFVGQMVGFALLTLSMAHARGRTGTEQSLQGLRQVPRLIEQVLNLDPQIARIATRWVDKSSALFIGRGSLFPIALEGALKLKEISYIHAEAYPAGELKHGPLALVDKNMPVLGLIHADAYSEKMLSNLQEVHARGGELFLVSDISHFSFMGATIIPIPSSLGLFAPAILQIMPLQLLAYHVAVLRGTDVDQPRNLAKSVTVE